ncbi:MAG: ThiF family adenylyltransferase [Armatimonadetes bacterium]|nr:ThiF family adenylyltransferase [Armatimonadota bacterium]
MDTYYEEIFVRNTGLVEDKVQQTIKDTKLLICGIGMGSLIAELALRTGFVFLTLVDNDRVAMSNLNRQAYTFSDARTAKRKTHALKRRLLAINPYAKIQVLTRYVTSSGLPKVINSTDVIIDAIDISEMGAILAVQEQARKAEKVVFSPFNLANSSALIVFDKDSSNLQEMLGVTRRDDTTFVETMTLWLDFCLSNQKKFPQRFLRFMKNYTERIRYHGWCPLPQLGTTTYLTAALTVSVIVQYLHGEKVRLAPEFYVCTLP